MGDVVGKIRDGMGNLSQFEIGSKEHLEAVGRLQEQVSLGLATTEDGNTVAVLTEFRGLLDALGKLDSLLAAPAPDGSVAQPDDVQRAQLRSLLSSLGADEMAGQLAAIFASLHEYLRESAKTGKLMRLEEYKTQIAELRQAAEKIRLAAEERFKGGIFQGVLTSVAGGLQGAGGGLGTGHFGKVAVNSKEKIGLERTEKFNADMRDYMNRNAAYTKEKNSLKPGETPTLADPGALQNQSFMKELPKIKMMDVLARPEANSDAQFSNIKYAQLPAGAGQFLSGGGQVANSSYEKGAGLLESDQKKDDAEATEAEHKAAISEEQRKSMQDLLESAKATLEQIESAVARANEALAAAAA
jgi:hypothetical protein